MMNCGETQPTRPSLGSWLTYGLGTENQNLPGFVVLCPGKPVVGPQLWSNSFLPGIYQGTHINNAQHRPEDASSSDVNNRYLPPAAQREQLDLLQQMNEMHLDAARRRRPARGAHPVAGDGLPDAVRGAGRLRPRARRRRRRAKLYGNGAVRQRLPDRPAGWPSAACAWCRSTTATASRGTTTPTSSTTATTPSRRDQADRRPADGPEARGPARRHAGRLGRRVRPDADVAKGPKGRDHNNHGLHRCGWPAAASRAAWPTAPPTSSASRPSDKKVHVHDLHATILHLHGHRPREADLPLQRPRLPADRRVRRGGEGHPGVTTLRGCQRKHP